MTPLVLGLDSGWASAGYAIASLGDPIVVENMGVIRTEASAKKRLVKSSDDYARRGRNIARVVQGLLTDRVVAICIESPSLPRNSATCFKLGCFYGLVYAFSEARGLPILNISPQELKKGVCDNATASKEDVAVALRRRFGTDFDFLLGNIPPSLHEHAYDALGAIVSCLDSEILRLARRMT